MPSRTIAVVFRQSALSAILTAIEQPTHIKQSKYLIHKKKLDLAHMLLLSTQPGDPDCTRQAGRQSESPATLKFILPGVLMRKSVINLAIAAAALVGAASVAQAKVVLTLQSYDSTGTVLLDTKTCDSSNFGACGAGFIQVSNGLIFTGSLVGFNVSTTSFTGNMPGTPLVAQLNASTTFVDRVGSGTGFFYIDVYATDYLFPAGNDKYLTGSASLSSTGAGTGDYLESRFYADGTNAGLASNMTSCTQSIISSNNCDATTIPWTDANAGSFSMRDIQIFRMSNGASVNTTASGKVTPVPEPVSLSLVGAALVVAGAAARRKAKKA